MDAKTYEVAQKILSKNDLKARELRELYRKKNLYVVNLMSSPGSGKTTLLEGFARQKSLSFAVIEGDLETNRDAARLEALNIPAHQITTGDACHLEAAMIEGAFLALESAKKLENLDFLFIENVGNLVCPASYDLGAALNLVLLSSPEGDDKVLKYPTMFLLADAVLVTKSDIMQHFKFSLSQVERDLKTLNSRAKIFVVSDKNPDSIEALAAFLRECKKNNYASPHIF